MKLSLKVNQFQNQAFQNHSRVLVKELQSLGLDMRVLDEDDYEVELRDLDEGEDDDVMHVDDLEKARVQQAKEAAELEKAKEEASDKTE